MTDFFTSTNSSNFESIFMTKVETQLMLLVFYNSFNFICNIETVSYVLTIYNYLSDN